LCSLDNPPPVRVISATHAVVPGRFVELLDPRDYPEGADIGNHRQQIVQHQRQPALIPANLFPHCYRSGSHASLKPVCPDNVRTLGKWTLEQPQNDQVKPWLLRGAVNAGLAAFVFLDLLSRDPTKNKLIRYDECELIGK
jgi:hypothetical protein